jgi:cation/acetate symporter
VLVAGYFGINPPAYVAQVVAFAFGLAAASFFPAIVMGIFYKRMNRQGAIAGMLAGFGFTAMYIIYFRFINPAADNTENWWFGISPEGIGTLGAMANLAVAYTVAKFTPAPPLEVQKIVERIRLPGDV